MKKSFLVCLAILGFTMAKAQDDADKKFRFGLKISPSINWLRVDDEKTYEKGGSVPKFGYGLMTEFKLTDVAWFSTGFQVDYDGGKIEARDTVGYLYDEDKGFKEADDINYTDASTYTGYTAYMMNKRQYKSMYLSIPLMLRLKTKEIGYLTYFGNIGLLTSVHIRTRSNDNVSYFDLNSLSYKTTDLEKLDISKDMNFLKTGLVLGGGAEMNLSGSTSILFGISFYQGFMNSVKKNSRYNIDGEKTADAGSAKPVRQEQKFLSRNFSLTVGVLF